MTKSTMITTIQEKELDLRQGCPLSKERRLSMEYQVLAIKWSLEKGAQVEYIAGEFPDYVNAKIFAEAYTNHFYTKTTIVKKGA